MAMSLMQDTSVDIYLTECYEYAAQSTDPSTQVGAIAVAENGLMIGYGFNAIPAAFAVDPSNVDRDTKLRLTVHAETSALIDAAGQVDTLFCPWYACEGCAAAIARAGVRRVVGHTLMRDFATAYNSTWDDSIDRALMLLERAGVICDWYDQPLPDAPAIRIGGKMFDPAQCRLEI